MHDYLKWAITLLYHSILLYLVYLAAKESHVWQRTKRLMSAPQYRIF